MEDLDLIAITYVNSDIINHKLIPPKDRLSRCRSLTEEEKEIIEPLMTPSRHISNYDCAFGVYFSIIPRETLTKLKSVYKHQCKRKRLLVFKLEKLLSSVLKNNKYKLEPDRIIWYNPDQDTYCGRRKEGTISCSGNISGFTKQIIKSLKNSFKYQPYGESGELVIASEIDLSDEYGFEGKHGLEGIKFIGNLFENIYVHAKGETRTEKNEFFHHSILNIDVDQLEINGDETIIS